MPRTLKKCSKFHNPQIKPYMALFSVKKKQKKEKKFFVIILGHI